MDWKKFREAVGFLSVLAGLVFVGAELRQTNQLARQRLFSWGPT
jgi:hypothetical protein